MSLLSPADFLKALHLEQKRAERSRCLLALLLVECGPLAGKTGRRRNESAEEAGARALGALSRASRETDVKGWYRNQDVLGVIFTDIPSGNVPEITEVLGGKVRRALSQEFGEEALGEAAFSLYVYPEDWHRNEHDGTSLVEKYPDLVRSPMTGPGRHVKRAVDIVGSLLALIVLSPVFLAAALAVKLTSRGPVIFRQQRLGYGSRPFTFLKFRSMYENNDPAIHQEFVAKLISGADQGAGEKPQGGAFKIQADPRVTRVGRFLRKSSLDELPQFINVLRGEMSLVGPRPPVPYEVDRYDIWHRHRLLAAKPGITGLWQVEGRSRVRFDEMVRLDLRYAANWSLWLDFKILLSTPLAVFSGNGAR